MDGYIKDPLTGAMLLNKQNDSSSDNKSPLSAAEVAGLEQMTREELIALVRRCVPEEAKVLCMTTAERLNAMRDKLAIMALTSDDAKVVLAAVREYLDREEGKSVERQLVHSTSTVNVVMQNALRDLRAMDKETVLELKRVLERKREEE